MAVALEAECHSSTIAWSSTPGDYPLEAKVRDGRGKWILREILAALRAEPPDRSAQDGVRSANGRVVARSATR